MGDPKIIFENLDCRFKELPSHIQSNQLLWQRFYNQSEYENIVPPPWDQLDPFKQLVLAKHLKPLSLMTSMKVFLFHINNLLVSLFRTTA